MPPLSARPGLRRTIPLLVLSLLFTWSAGFPQTDGVLVFAAASQKEALDAVIAAYGRQSTIKVRATYLSSSTLARQIEQGAPADVFISANPKWMDYLQGRSLIDPRTRTDLLSNTLVLIGPPASRAQVEIKPGFDLVRLLGSGRLAVGDPDHVPAGIYAKQALMHLGVWASVQDRLARADNVRVALALVARGEAPLGIVYGSDAAADDKVRVLGHFPQTSHPRIVYPVAITAGTRRAQQAGDFLRFLKGAEAAALYERFGFRPLR